MIPELLKSLAGSVVRWLLTAVGAWLVSKNIVSESDFNQVVIGIAAGGAALAWSFWNKYKQRLLLLLALDLPAGASEEVAKQKAASSTSGVSVWMIAFLLTVLVAGGMVGCAKKIDGESPANYKSRKTGIYVVQSFEGLRGFSKMIGVFSDNNLISDGGAKAAWTFSEKAATSLDVVGDRLRDGLPADALGRIDTLLNDVDAAEASGLLGIRDAAAQAKYKEVIFSVRFTLKSIKAVIEASKAPSFVQAQAMAAQATRQRSNISWWTDAVLVVQETAINWFTQSRIGSAADAWAEVKVVSAAVHEINKVRLGL